MDDPAGHFAWLDGMNQKIDAYFKKKQYVKIGTEGPNGGSYVNPKTGTFIADTKPGNVVEVATPQGPRLKFIDGVLEQGHDNPSVKRAIEMANEVKQGLRDPSMLTEPLEKQGPCAAERADAIGQHAQPDGSLAAEADDGRPAVRRAG